VGKPVWKVELEGMKSVAFVTVGCKLNQFETEQMRELIEANGFEGCSAPERADVLVINTCTVTSKSDYRSRQAVRRAVRSNPDALVVVTGCYAQLSPHDIAMIDGVDVILGNAEKEEILRYIDIGRQHEPVIRVTDSGALTEIRTPVRLRGFGKYTRAFVKIQDGCDNHCTYCAVPLARGRSRSRPVDEVRAEIEVLAGQEYREVVLTGVHLGSYGKDLEPPTTLAALLPSISRISGLERVRLSSIEPTDFSDELIEILSEPAMRICPHVHVPLQSGDDVILRRMGRPYTRTFYEDLILKLADRVRCSGIGADVMVGFPGEDHGAFRNTYDLLKGLPVTYLHVFSFSERPGTHACGMKPRVEPVEKKRRSRLLRQLGRAKSHEFRRSLVGKRLQVLVLDSSRGRACGLSGNYVKVYFEDSVSANAILPCSVSAVVEGGVRATIDGDC
jgi:threonylcarbamoyladenosine tRNA methylthiotransferase MtaB